MFNNFFWGLSSGGGSGGGGDALPTAVNGVTFDKVEAMANFANQLGPPPAEVITQTQGDAPTVGNIPHHPPPPGVGGGMNPPPPPPQQAGMGGGQQPTGDSAYSSNDSVIKKLGGRKAKLAVQQRGTPGDLANRTSFREIVVVYLAMLGNQTHVSMIHTP
jgi:hypothetical protein